jgi:hypothetical protein
MSKNTFLEAVEFCMKNSYFQYNDMFFELIDNCAMGNPASAPVAELSMYCLLENVLKKIPFDLHVKKYVDDFFLLVVANGN